MPARDHIHEHVRRALVNDGWPVGQLLLSKGRVRLLVFSTEAEVIEQWTPKPPTAT
jgi:hypothetical protein